VSTVCTGLIPQSPVVNCRWLLETWLMAAALPQALPARPDQEIHRTRDRVCYGAWAASGLCSKSCLYWRKPRLSIAAVPRGGHREWKGKGSKARDVIK
jgi:hypothetical protein